MLKFQQNRSWLFSVLEYASILSLTRNVQRQIDITSVVDKWKLQQTDQDVVQPNGDREKSFNKCKSHHQ